MTASKHGSSHSTTFLLPSRPWYAVWLLGLCCEEAGHSYLSCLMCLSTPCIVWHKTGPRNWAPEPVFHCPFRYPPSEAWWSLTTSATALPGAGPQVWRALPRTPGWRQESRARTCSPSCTWSRGTRSHSHRGSLGGDGSDRRPPQLSSCSIAPAAQRTFLLGYVTIPLKSNVYDWIHASTFQPITPLLSCHPLNPDYPSHVGPSCREVLQATPAPTPSRFFFSPQTPGSPPTSPLSTATSLPISPRRENHSHEPSNADLQASVLALPAPLPRLPLIFPGSSSPQVPLMTQASVSSLDDSPSSRCMDQCLKSITTLIPNRQTVQTELV